MKLADSRALTDDSYQEVVMAANADTSAGQRIYYPGPGIVVTSHYIETAQPRYRVRDLIVENPRYFYAYPARAVALYCGAVELLLAIGLGAFYGSVALLCVAGAVTGTGLAAAIW